MGFNKDTEDGLIINQEAVPKMDETLPQTNHNQSAKETIPQPENGIGAFLGKEIDELKAVMGTPSRVDLSAYGFHWWIFNTDMDRYIQLGVLNGRVVTAYGVGPAVNVEPFKIGQPIEQLFAMNMIDHDITFEHNGSSYKFELSEEEMNTRPLVKMGDYYAQLYIDRFTGLISSIRFMDKETLIKQRPYEMVYRGNLLEPPVLTESDWLRVEAGAEKQILDITNVLRTRHELNVLKWDEKTSEAAFGHSKDMAEEEYFSHESAKFGTLSDRLKAAEVLYQLAGENIAANYTDAPAVVEGWLNSASHREALLNEEYTHLGVGVYRKHYTQNFVQLWVQEQEQDDEQEQDQDQASLQ